MVRWPEAGFAVKGTQLGILGTLTCGRHVSNVLASVDKCVLQRSPAVRGDGERRDDMKDRETETRWPRPAPRSSMPETTGNWSRATNKALVAPGSASRERERKGLESTNTKDSLSQLRQ